MGYYFIAYVIFLLTYDFWLKLLNSWEIMPFFTGVYSFLIRAGTSHVSPLSS